MSIQSLTIGAILLLMVASPFSGAAQKDSSLLLTPEQLREKDVSSFKKEKSMFTFSSANRMDEELMDIPFSTWVITSDEILRYGFVTLVDVLKAAPGIRVSQPGNSTEGETFMMRGLSGNQYVKILINNVPIKPSGTLGMPIGAQLPIRQAERIEVMYGTGGAMMYGNEACAGVVNIILKETDRPIFTQADLGFGSKSFNNLDLMFGGRLFRDNNVLKFSLYGSSTVRNFGSIRGDLGNEVFEVDNYLLQGMTTDDLNFFRRYDESLDPESANYFSASNLAHESRMFGMLIDWRGLEFTYHRMERSDHSSLGYSPLSFSYATQDNILKEKMDVYNLRVFLKRERLNLVSNMTFERYNIDDFSTMAPIFDARGALAFKSRNLQNVSHNDKQVVLGTYADLWVNGPRYINGGSRDLRWENTGSVKLAPFLTAHAGMLFSVLDGSPQAGYLRTPNREYLGDNSRYFNVLAHIYNSYNLDFKNWKISGGYSVSVEGVGTPRFSVLYKIDSLISLFANVSKAYKVFHPYQDLNTYSTDTLSFITYLNHTSPEQEENLSSNRYTERVESFEIGIKRRFSELLFFGQNAYNLAEGGMLYTNRDNKLISGYYYPAGLSQKLWGIQLRLVGLSTAAINPKRSGVAWKGEAFVQYTRGKEFLPLNYGTTDAIRNFPRWITQLRSSGRSGKFQMTLAYNRQSSVLSKGAVFNSGWGRKLVRESHAGFSTTDIMGRFYLNKNFVLYFNILNVFNRKSYGLDANGSFDDLLAPVQLRRQTRLGITYNMN